jgi:hypothetical protein
MPSAATPDTLQIFKPGRHTAMSGDVLEFSEADLVATAKAYDPAKHEAPLVVGHPRTDDPAYGWVQSLHSDGHAIEAGTKEVDPAFAELVNTKKFKKISASFYAPDAPNNPVPGVYYLRHVGFLGAAAPAVKGLRTPSFAAAEVGVVEFSEWDDVTNASLWRSMREWFIGKFGLQEADKVIPGYQVQSLEQAAQDEVREAAAESASGADTNNLVAGNLAAPAFSAPEPAVTPAQAQALETENARLKADLAAAQATQRQARLAAAHAENVAFAEGLVAQGRLPKGHLDIVVAELDHHAAQPAPVEFGETGARKPLVTELKAMLAALPVRVEFGEVATAGRAAGGNGAKDSVLDFAAPAGFGIDQESLVTHRRVLAYQAAHPTTDYIAALAAVQRGAV